MRKQYYFLRSDRGFNAWDVDRLVERSSGFPVITIALDEISELDENFWYQGAADVPTTRSLVEHCRLIQETDLDFPIILSPEGRVMDGMHRVTKALLLGHKSVKAVQFKEDIQPDYRDVFPEELPY